MHTSKTIEFWYEFASTYSYLSALRIEDLAQKSGVTVRWRPFLLGPIFREQGWSDSPFNLYPAKGRYMWRDLERRAKKYGLGFLKPTHFPRNGLLASRIALLGSDAGWGAEFSRRVYLANFSEDQEIAEPDVLRIILKDIVRDPQEVLELAQGEELKKKLRIQTEHAQSLGIFGAPSFIANGELFWGDDRLEDALEYSMAKN